MERSCAYRVESKAIIGRHPEPLMPLAISSWALKWAREMRPEATEVYIFWDDCRPETVDVVIYEKYAAKTYTGIYVPGEVLDEALEALSEAQT
jgi:hypothetical protein